MRPTARRSPARAAVELLGRAASGGWPSGLALFCAVLATFADAIFTRAAFYQRDILSYWYPHRAVALRALAEGSLPLWNPFSGFGAPLLADASTQLVYPPSWLGLLLPAALHYKLFAVGHTLLAAAGAWALARRLGLDRNAAAVAGGAYGLSGPLLSSVSLYHHHVGASWLPWLLWALEGLIRTPAAASALGLGLVTAAQVLAGSGDMCLAGALLGAGRLAVHLADPRTSGRLRLLRLAAAAACLAGALAAVQWLPTAMVATQSPRSELTARTNTYWSLHPASLLDTAVPRLVAELPLSSAARAAVFEGREPLLACIYLGIVPLALAGLALVTRPRAGFKLAAGFALLLLASLGRHTPFYSIVLTVPGFNVLRYPQKLLLPAALCLSLLAALGAAAWDGAWSRAERRRVRWLSLLLLALTSCAVAASLWVAREPAWLRDVLEPAGSGSASIWRALALRLLRFALAAAVIALLFWRRGARESTRSWGLPVLLLLGAFDLVAVGRGTNPLAPPALPARRPAVVERLDDGARVHTTSEQQCLAPGQGPAGWLPSWNAALAFQETLRPPAGSRFGVYGSYDGDFTGLGSPQEALFAEATRRLADAPAGLRLLEIANVGHVLHVGRTVSLGLVPVAILPSHYVCPLVVLRVPNPLPRAYAVSVERRAAGPENTLLALLAADFDPRREVVLEGSTGPGAGSLGRSEARIVARTLNSVLVDAKLEAPGVLVLVEGFAPGWRAEVDGRSVDLLRANGLFRAVRLGAGAHRVLFSYRPWAVAIGALLSAAGLAVALWLAVRLSRLRPSA